MCGLFNPHDIIARDRKPVGGFEVDYVDLGADVMLSALSYAPETRIVAPPLRDFFVFQFTLQGECRNTVGSDRIRAMPGSLCVLNRDQPIRQDMSAGYRQMAMRVSRDVLEQTLEEEIGYRVREPLVFACTPQPLRNSVATLARTVGTVWNDLQRGGAGYVQPAVRDRSARTLASLLLVGMPHNHSELFMHRGAGAAPFFVRRAELYMRDTMTENLTLSLIADTVGVSVRTLQNGFRRFRSTTPMAYLKSLRLNAARELLVKSCGRGGTVTGIALECGFSHLSKFAQDYRNAFGESPSETARRGSN